MDGADARWLLRGSGFCLANLANSNFRSTLAAVQFKVEQQVLAQIEQI